MQFNCTFLDKLRDRFLICEGNTQVVVAQRSDLALFFLLLLTIVGYIAYHVWQAKRRPQTGYEAFPLL